MIDADPTLVNGVAQVGLGGVGVLMLWVFKMMLRLHKRIDAVNTRLDSIAERQDRLTARLDSKDEP
jgi:hypothetical protein